MARTPQEQASRALVKKIRAWAQYGVRNNRTHMILSRSWAGTNTVPLYVKQGKSVHERMHDLEIIGEQVVEVYNLTLPLEEQLAERQAWHADEVALATAA